MNIALAVPIADSWGMHNGSGGWWIAGAAVMMLFMGGMMWMMMRGMGRKESPAEILDRRFAEGEISAEEYRARRDLLVNGTAASNGATRDEGVTAAGTEERSQ